MLSFGRARNIVAMSSPIGITCFSLTLVFGNVQRSASKLKSFHLAWEHLRNPGACLRNKKKSHLCILVDNSLSLDLQPRTQHLSKHGCGQWLLVRLHLHSGISSYHVATPRFLQRPNSSKPPVRHYL